MLCIIVSIYLWHCLEFMNEDIYSPLDKAKSIHLHGKRKENHAYKGIFEILISCITNVHEQARNYHCSRFFLFTQCLSFYVIILRGAVIERSILFGVCPFFSSANWCGLMHWVIPWMMMIIVHLNHKIHLLYAHSSNSSIDDHVLVIYASKKRGGK